MSEHAARERAALWAALVLILVWGANFSVQKAVFAALSGKHIAMPGDPASFYGYGLMNIEERGVRLWMHGGFSRATKSWYGSA